MRIRKRLGEMLLEEGLVTQEQLNEALEMQRRTGRRLGRVVVELGLVTEAQVADVLARHLNLKRLDLDRVTVPKEVLRLIPEELMERYEVFPVAVADGVLQLAMVEPDNIYALDDIRRVTRLRVEPFLVTPGELRRARERHFDVHETAREVIQRFGMDVDEEKMQAAIEDVSDSAGVQLVNLIIEQAVNSRASDIHIEPQADSARVRHRVDGRLRHMTDLPKRLVNDVISRIKVMAQLDITNRRTPQDGRIRVEVDGREVDLRASTLPTIHGEKVVLRILSTAKDIITLDKLSFQPESMAAVEKMLGHSEGMILVTGPTGSGKTTTLYSFLNELNTPEVNITTIEDPVEIRLPGVNQVGVSTRGGVTFASALRSVLRQDPDIIMVGEMRDEETASIAVRAALTGHLVLSTLHTNSAAATLARLVDMGIPPYLVSGTVIGIIAQRLVRKLCCECRRPVTHLDPAEEEFLGPDARRGVIYEAVGCPVCSHQGFRGRVAIEEVLLTNREIKRLVRDNASEDELVETARRYGFVTLKENAIRRVLAGETTVREVMRVVHNVAEDESLAAESAPTTASI
ncbi:MAG: ATPase, T2SS/T4P/T4SS family [Limnochordales bacterium]